MLVLGLFRLEVQSLLFASGFQFFDARRLSKPLRLLLFDAQPLFGRDPFKPRRLRFRLLTRKHRLAVGFQILFHVEEEQDDRAKAVAHRLDPDVGDDRARRARTDQRGSDALRHRRGGDHDRTVDGHDEPVAAEPALRLDMIEAVRNHREDHVPRGRGAEALQGDAHRSHDHVVIADTRDHPAGDADDHADDAHRALAELVAQRRHEEHRDRHGHCTDDAENARDRIGREGLRRKDLRIEVEGGILDAAAELVQKVKDDDDPEIPVSDGGLCLPANADARLCLRLLLPHALFRHALAREVVLHDRPEEGDDGDNDEEDHPERPLRAEAHLRFDEDAEQEGKDHRARAHRAEQRHVDKGRQHAALIGVARRERR